MKFFKKGVLDENKIIKSPKKEGLLRIIQKKMNKN